MSPRTLVILCAITAGLLGAFGDGLLNKGSKVIEGRLWWYFGGFVVWNASLWFFLQVLKRGGLIDSVLLFSITNCIAVVLLSQLVFREHVSSDKWIAVCIGFVVVIVLSKH